MILIRLLSLFTTFELLLFWSGTGVGVPVGVGVCEPDKAGAEPLPLFIPGIEDWEPDDDELDDDLVRGGGTALPMALLSTLCTLR